MSVPMNGAKVNMNQNESQPPQATGTSVPDHLLIPFVNRVIKQRDELITKLALADANADYLQARLSGIEHLAQSLAEQVETLKAKYESQENAVVADNAETAAPTQIN